MKYINIVEVIGTDERCWHLSGEEVHYTGHMYRNSPYETDSDCGNCNGARCDSCKRVVEQPRWVASIPCNILEEAIKTLAPELPNDAVSELVYDDFCSSVEYNGQRYCIKYPEDNWIVENCPEMVDKLSTIVQYVEVISETQNLIPVPFNKITSEFYLFDTAEESEEFFNDCIKKFTSEDSYLKDYGTKDFRVIQYNTKRNVTVINHSRSYEMALSTFYNVDVHYHDDILKFRESKLVND